MMWLPTCYIPRSRLKLPSAALAAAIRAEALAANEVPAITTVGGMSDTAAVARQVSVVVAVAAKAMLAITAIRGASAAPLQQSRKVSSPPMARRS